MKSQVWSTLYKIPHYLIQGITDQGLARTVFEDGSSENDDLVIAIELSGGSYFLCPHNCRLVATADNLEVQLLINLEE